MRNMPHAIFLLVLMWLLQLAQTLSWNSLDSYGILPRDMSGLLGIPLAPWIHHNWWHLINNSVPFLILGILIQAKSTAIFWESTLFIVLISGIGTWLLGATAYHIGASGLVLGYLSFIITDAYFHWSFKAVFIAVVTFAIYGGMLFTLFDFRPHISWAGHISGLFAGIIVAVLWRNKARQI